MCASMGVEIVREFHTIQKLQFCFYWISHCVVNSISINAPSLTGWQIELARRRVLSYHHLWCNCEVWITYFNAKAMIFCKRKVDGGGTVMFSVTEQIWCAIKVYDCEAFMVIYCFRNVQVFGGALIIKLTVKKCKKKFHPPI